MATEIRKVTTLAWRKMLATEAGMEGMLFLRESGPVIVKGENHQMIFDAGRVEGYKEAINKISDIIAVQEARPIDPSND